MALPGQPVCVSMCSMMEFHAYRGAWLEVGTVNRWRNKCGGLYFCSKGGDPRGGVDEMPVDGQPLVRLHLTPRHANVNMGGVGISGRPGSAIINDAGSQWEGRMATARAALPAWRPWPVAADCHSLIASLNPHDIHFHIWKWLSWQRGSFADRVRVQNI